MFENQCRKEGCSGCSQCTVGFFNPPQISSISDIHKKLLKDVSEEDLAAEIERRKNRKAREKEASELQKDLDFHNQQAFKLRIKIEELLKE